MPLDNLMRESSKIICVSKFMLFQFGLFFKTSLMHPSIIHLMCFTAWVFDFSTYQTSLKISNSRCKHKIYFNMLGCYENLVCNLLFYSWLVIVFLSCCTQYNNKVLVGKVSSYLRQNTVPPFLLWVPVLGELKLKACDRLADRPCLIWS